MQDASVETAPACVDVGAGTFPPVINSIQTPVGRWAHIDRDRVAVSKRPGLQFPFFRPEPILVPARSFRRMSDERTPHASALNPARRLAQAAPAGRFHRLSRDSDHRLRLGRMDAGKYRQGI